MPSPIESLNENQRNAVLWNDGPLLVLAGPGSGKTRVLTLRVSRLLQEREDVAVLALTFTTKAAAEMRERVDQLLGHRGDRAQLCTFHSFATDVLRQHGSHVGIHPDFTLLTQEEDRVALVDEVARALANAGHAIPEDRRSVLALIDRLFSESYDGSPQVSWMAQTPEWVPPLFGAYCKGLLAANRLDFGSLLGFARRLLTEKPAVARVLRLAWTHVCVDEFQDANRAQYDLLKLMVAEKKPNLFVVGDDDQIIYQWNGASPERLHALRRDYEMEVVQLPENYRCPREIIGLANKLIAHNRNRAADKKPLTAFRAAGMRDDVVRLGAFSTPEDEVAVLAQDIKARGLKPTDCVVIARTTKLLDAAAGALKAAGVEAFVTKRKIDFDVPVVRVMFQALRLANARHDRDVLRRLCVAWRSVSDQVLEVEDVAASATVVGGDFLRAWVDAAVQTAVSSPLVARIRDSLVDKLEFASTVDWFLADGWKLGGDENDPDLAAELSTWRDLHGDIVREQGSGGLTLNVYLQRMDLSPKTPRPPANAVRCITVHGAKGLEFKHVYLVGMAQGVLPSYQALKKGPASHELEEERRNCFVAITRVQESLTLTHARQYNGWQKARSQFLDEMELTESGEAE